MKTLKNILHRIICAFCGDDIDAKGQDNMGSDSAMCEDCYNSGK